MLRSIMATCAIAIAFSANAFAGDLVLIRHGNSQHNLTHEYNSNPKHLNYRVSCLTPLGVKQTVKTAEKLKQAGYNNDTIAEVVVSPLPRTRQTAKVLMEQGLFTPEKIRIDDRLTEVNYGEREGLSTDLFNEDPWECHNSKEIYGGEENHQVRQRMLSAYRDTVKTYGEDPNKHVLYVTHGLPSLELIDHIQGERTRLQTAEAVVLPMRKK